ncbi:hypothetical protein FRC10_008286, partial [Ceratobasidium sp. 414]
MRIQRARMDAYLGRVAPDGAKRQWSRVVYEEDEDMSWQASVGHVAAENAEKLGLGASKDKGESKGDGEGEGGEDEDEDEEETRRNKRHAVYPNPTLSIALKPTAGRVRGLDLVTKYGATELIPALHRYLKRHATRQNLPSNFLPTAHHTYPVWHRLYLRHRALPFDPEWPRRDVIRARPEDEEQPAVFDVAMFLERCHEFGLQRKSRYELFVNMIPRRSHSCYFCASSCVPVPFPFSTAVSPFHGMHSLSHALQFDGKRRTVVLSAFDLAAAIHLAPQYKRLAPDLDLASLPDMLTESRYFWLNPYYNHYLHGLIDHWRSVHEASQG